MYKSGILLMMITLLSRVLGLVRTMIIASLFGATGATDAYFSAFKISNFFRQLLGEGALGVTFIPLYNEMVEKDGKEAGRQFIFSVLNLLFLVTFIISLLTVIGSDVIINIIVRGFSPETKLAASKHLKIMAFYLLFIGMTGMIAAILNNFKQFVIPASTSLLFNISIIAHAYFFESTLGVFSLSWGVLIGGILQLIWVLPSFFKIVKGISLKVNFKDLYLKRIFILIIPMLVGIFARQINSISDQIFASYLPSGSVTALENATRVYGLPLGVFGISIATIIFPTLSKSIEKKDFVKVEETLTEGMQILLILIIPSMTALIFMGDDIVRIIFARGSFSQEAVVRTREALQFYTLGLYFYTGIHLLSRAFYGLKDTRTPVKLSVVSIMLNIILNLLLIGMLKHKGLALSTAIASMVNFFGLWIILQRKHFKINCKKLVLFALFSIGASIISYIGTKFVYNSFSKLIVFSLIYLSVWCLPFFKYYKGKKRSGNHES